MSNTDLRTFRHIIGQNEEDESHYLKPGGTQRHRQRWAQDKKKREENPHKQNRKLKIWGTHLYKPGVNSVARKG
jgi:hypothetical protein